MSIALGRAIVQQIWPQAGELQVMALDSGLERLLTQALQGNAHGAGIEPGLAETLLREASGASKRQEQAGLMPVLLVPAAAANVAVAFPAPRAAAAQDTLARRNARFQQY